MFQLSNLPDQINRDDLAEPFIQFCWVIRTLEKLLHFGW